MQITKKIAAIGVTLAGVTTAGILTFAGPAFAENTASPSPAASASSDGTQPTTPQGHKGGGGSQDTPVTGDEAQKVIDAVKAKDSAATIDTVRKDPDGTYDALGTKNGTPVMYDVSTDLHTITENAGPQR